MADTSPDQKCSARTIPGHSSAHKAALDQLASRSAPTALHATATSDGKYTQPHERRIFSQQQWVDQKKKQGSTTPRPQSERSK
jgi:hypothetical protein